MRLETNRNDERHIFATLYDEHRNILAEIKILEFMDDHIEITVEPSEVRVKIVDQEHKDLERVHKALIELYGKNQGEATYDHLILEMREAKEIE